MSKPQKLSFNNVFNWFRRGKMTAETALFEKSEYGIWAEALNPLRGLTASRALDIFDRARRGIYAELAWLYQEIEAVDPTIFVCAERREGASAAADWRIAPRVTARTVGFDERLAAEQVEWLEMAYGRAGDGLGAAAEHLARAFFRGFAHCRPVFDSDGLVAFELYDQWNFARDPATGDWWWNPDASVAASSNFKLIPSGELTTLTRPRHIDYPALMIYIRAAMGERGWGLFIERYGIPPVTIIMPEFVDKGEEQAYMNAATKVARGGSGALPYGSQVSYASEARGADPFDTFLRHQQEHIVMLATGGILTTLSAPGSGTLAGNAHEETWRGIVARDIQAVARALNRSVTPRLLAMRFPGQPQLVDLEYSVEPPRSAGEIFEDATKARAAGYRVLRSDLEARTGYELEDEPQAPGAMGYPLMTHKAAAGAGATPGAVLDAPGVASPPDPMGAALAVIEAGGEVDAALDAFDAAALATLEPEALTRRAEEVAAALDEAVTSVFMETTNE